MDTKENILMGTIGFIFMVPVRVLLSGTHGVLIKGT